MAESIEVGVKFNPTGLDALSGKLKAALGQAAAMARQSFQATGIVPNWSTNPTPNAHKPTSPNAKQQGINFGQLFGGLLTAPFSPWIAARMIGGSGLFGRGGGANNLFGVGGLTGFNLAFIGIKSSAAALKTAFDQLSHSVQIGSRLFEESARTATNTETLARLQRSFQAVGLSPELANRFLENVFLSKGRGIAQSMGSMNGTQMTDLVKAMGTGELADLQQIMNMAPEFQKAWANVASDAKIVGDAAQPMQRMNQSTQEMKSAWNAMVTSMTVDFIPGLSNVIDKLSLAVRAFSALSMTAKIWTVFGGPEGAAKGAQAFAGQGVTGFFTKFINSLLGTTAGVPMAGQPGKTRIQEAFKPQPRSEWERMGLIINGGIAGNDYAKQTATNTKRTADALVGLTKGPMGFLQGLPSASNMP